MTHRLMTDDMLWRMLRENTGRAMCDSGDYYGRSWERNAKKSLQDFRNDPEVRLQFSVHNGKLSVDGTVSVFHFLSKALGPYRPDLTKRYRDWCRKKEGRYYNTPGYFDEWLEVIHAQSSGCVNTYNGADALSQTLQYTQFSMDGEDFVGMSIHGGCDVRGGYTDIRVFELSDGSDVALWDNARFVVFAENTKPETPPAMLPGFPVLPQDTDNSQMWYTYDAGYTFEVVDGDVLPLQEYEGTTDPETRGKGVVYVDDEQHGYSPVNGVLLVGAL